MEITALITAYAMLVALLIVAKLVSHILGTGSDGEARKQRDKKRRR